MLSGGIFVHKAPLITTNAKALRGLLRAVFEISRERSVGLRQMKGRRLGGNKNKFHGSRKRKERYEETEVRTKEERRIRAR